MQSSKSISQNCPVNPGRQMHDFGVPGIHIPLFSHGSPKKKVILILYSLCFYNYILFIWWSYIFLLKKILTSVNPSSWFIVYSLENTHGLDAYTWRVIKTTEKCRKHQVSMDPCTCMLKWTIFSNRSMKKFSCIAVEAVTVRHAVRGKRIHFFLGVLAELLAHETQTFHFKIFKLTSLNSHFKFNNLKQGEKCLKTAK